MTDLVDDPTAYYVEKKGREYLHAYGHDWNLHSGYRVRGPISLHIWLWEKEHGSIPAGYEVDHINDDKRDNRLSNLQLLTVEEHKAKHKNNFRNPPVKVRHIPTGTVYTSVYSAYPVTKCIYDGEKGDFERV